MNPAEQTQILDAEDFAEAFTRLWTQKEAVLKLRGTGLVDDLHSVLTDMGNIQMETIVNKNRKYACSLAVSVT
jgi:phosphopantetheinyl transferase